MVCLSSIQTRFSIFVGEPPVILYEPVVQKTGRLFRKPITYLLCAIDLLFPAPVESVLTLEVKVGHADVQDWKTACCAELFNIRDGAVINVTPRCREERESLRGVVLLKKGLMRSALSQSLSLSIRKSAMLSTTNVVATFDRVHGVLLRTTSCILKRLFRLLSFFNTPRRRFAFGIVCGTFLWQLKDVKDVIYSLLIRAILRFCSLFCLLPFVER